ncbi:MAG: hypothetical protein NTX85_02540 [Candidatus Nomurabacteria bacterium]|nr:hypothetical protein [Candidatus Nomurabacteria bacterium]
MEWVKLLSKNKKQIMRSIKSRFDKIQNKYPSLGACIILAQAVRGRRFTQSSITREFTKLVPKDEYDKKERRTIIKFLVEVSNTLEDDTITMKN